MSVKDVGEQVKVSCNDFWTIDLAQHWPGVTLPRVSCERTASENRGLQGRCWAFGSKADDSDWIDLHKPLLLVTHREVKPWGAELWYTGIEKRGVCAVQSASGKRLPLPAYLALLAGPTASPQTPPLLKILDPLDDPNRGSLYLEIHREKWETYIVTGVSERLYPDGLGELLFGFEENKRAEFRGDEAAFRAALNTDVRKYEGVRRVLDGEHATNTLADLGLDSMEPLDQLERKLWQQLRSYFHRRKVKVGDVIQVPPFIPHSLQPGVRVVEFQTPTYERLILAFNQKVLTQAHWDTQEAVALAQMNPPTSSAFVEKNGWERVVDFPEFSVHRSAVEPGGVACWNESFERAGVLLFVISGQIAICGGTDEQLLSLTAEQAAFIPASTVNVGVRLRNVSQQPARLLIV